MATLGHVTGDDTWNEGREIFNTNDENLNTELVAATAAINTHKTSSDHDTRYYTEAEVDALLAALAGVQLTGNQTIDGQKTFTTSPIIKGNQAGVVVHSAAGDPIGQVLFQTTGGDNEVSILLYRAGTGYVTSFRIDKAGNLYGPGNIPIALKPYVDDRVRSGYFQIAVSRLIASLDTAQEYFIQDGNGDPASFVIPAGATMTRLSYKIRIGGTTKAVEDETESVPFTESGNRWMKISLKPVFVEGAWELFIRRYLYRRDPGDGLVYETILAHQTGEGVLATNEVELTLTLGFTL